MRPSYLHHPCSPPLAEISIDAVQQDAQQFKQRKNGGVIHSVYTLIVARRDGLLSNRVYSGLRDPYPFINNFRKQVIQVST